MIIDIDYDFRRFDVLSGQFLDRTCSFFWHLGLISATLIFAIAILRVGNLLLRNTLKSTFLFGKTVIAISVSFFLNTALE